MNSPYVSRHVISSNISHMLDSVGDLRNYADLPEKENKGILGFLRVKKRVSELRSDSTAHTLLQMVWQFGPFQDVAYLGFAIPACAVPALVDI